MYIKDPLSNIKYPIANPSSRPSGRATKLRNDEYESLVDQKQRDKQKCFWDGVTWARIQRDYFGDDLNLPVQRNYLGGDDGDREGTLQYSARLPIPQHHAKTFQEIEYVEALKKRLTSFPQGGEKKGEDQNMEKVKEELGKLKGRMDWADRDKDLSLAREAGKRETENRYRKARRAAQKKEMIIRGLERGISRELGRVWELDSDEDLEVEASSSWANDDRPRHRTTNLNLPRQEPRPVHHVHTIEPSTLNAINNLSLASKGGNAAPAVIEHPAYVPRDSRPWKRVEYAGDEEDVISAKWRLVKMRDQGSVDRRGASEGLVWR